MQKVVARPPAAAMPGRLRALSFRAAIFALIWLVLSEADPAAWPIGLTTVAAVTWLSLYLLPPTTLSLRGMLAFLPFFLWQSLRGGVDVAWRALHPRLPVDPQLVRFRLRFATAVQQSCMIYIMNLLPGTLSATLDGDILTVHVLNRHVAIENELQQLERIIAGVFRENLEEVANDETD